MTLKYFTAGAMTAALDLARDEVRQSIVELEIWSRLSPASTTVNATADDGSSAVSTRSNLARLIDGNGVECVLNKVEARELCSKVAVERFASPVRA